MANLSIHHQRFDGSAFVSDGLDLGLARSGNPLRDCAHLDGYFLHRSYENRRSNSAADSVGSDLRPRRLCCDEFCRAADDCASTATSPAHAGQQDKRCACAGVLHRAADCIVSPKKNRNALTPLRSLGYSRGMKKHLFTPLGKAVVSLILCLAVTSCASIFSGGPKKVSISTTPPGAKVTIYDKNGKVVSTGQTPTVVGLDRSTGYMAGQEYRIVIDKSGYRPTEVRVRANINGWYFGNLLIGGPLGLFVVDPLTGAMFTLSPDHINETLTPAQRKSMKKGPGFGIMLKEQLSPEQIQHLQRLTVQD